MGIWDILSIGDLSQDTQGVQAFDGHGQGQTAGKVFQKHLAGSVPCGKLCRSLKKDMW